MFESDHNETLCLVFDLGVSLPPGAPEGAVGRGNAHRDGQPPPTDVVREGAGDVRFGGVDRPQLSMFSPHASTSLDPRPDQCLRHEL